MGTMTMSVTAEQIREWIASIELVQKHQDYIVLRGVLAGMREVAADLERPQGASTRLADLAPSLLAVCSALLERMQVKWHDDGSVADFSTDIRDLLPALNGAVMLARATESET